MLNASSSSQTVPAVPIGMKKAQENVAGSMGSNPGAPGPQVSTPKEDPKPLEKPKKKLPIKYIVGGIVLILLLIGAGAGFYLTQINQDVRQQASTGDYESSEESCVSSCKAGGKSTSFCEANCAGSSAGGEGGCSGSTKKCVNGGIIQCFEGNWRDTGESCGGTECTGDVKRCVDGKYEKCSGGNYVKTSESCTVAECNTNAKRCNASGGTKGNYERCINGKWTVTSETCGYDANTCYVESDGCKSESEDNCSKSGSHTLKSQCQVAISGSSCSGNSTRCSGGDLERCFEGNWRVSEANSSQCSNTSIGGGDIIQPSSTACTDDICVAPTAGCIAVHHCSADNGDGNECTVLSPDVRGGSVDAQAEANATCSCVQVDVLNGENGSCENGHINGDISTLVDYSIVCPNISCAPSPIPSPSPTTGGDDDDNKTTTQSTPKPSPSPGLAICNEACTADSDCADAGHSCVGDVCRLTENPESETCSAVGCNEPCSVGADCTEANHTCLEFEGDGNPDGGVCRLIDYPNSETCTETTTPEPSPTPTVGCNDACVTDADCSDTDHSCNPDTQSCRLTENPGDENCAPAISPSPTPTPAPGCNEECYYSSECSNTSAVCYDNLCRLSTNPVDTACQPKATTQTTGEYYEQPDLPNALPSSGSEDILNWLKVGLGALGIGLVFLFL